MYTTILTVATLASYALAAPGQAESETTITAYKTITSCSGAAPVCTASSSEVIDTLYSTEVSTIISCAPTVKFCPARSTSVHSSIVPIVTASASSTPAESFISAVSTTPIASSPASSTELTSYITHLNTVTSCPGGKASTCPTSSVPVTFTPTGSATVSVFSSGVPSPSGNGTIVTEPTLTPSVSVFNPINAGSVLSFNSLLVVVVGLLGAIHTL